MNLFKTYHIVCIDRLGLIGADNKLLWSIPEELQFFKETTKYNVLIMGHNTFKSIGSKPLKHRINIVVTSSTEYEDTDELYFCNSIKEALELSQEICKELEAVPDQTDFKDLKVFIIGGSSIYNNTFDCIDGAYISTINYNYYNNTKIKDMNTVSYYDYEKLFEKNLNLLSSKCIYTTSTVHSVYTYKLEVNND